MYDTMPSHHQTYTSSPQVIDGQFVDQKKLISLLKDVYGTSDEGKNNFRVELRLNRYKIYPLARALNSLSEAQIEDCRAVRRR